MIVGAALLATPLVTLDASARPAQAAAPVQRVDSRPDAVSAMVTARAQGSRVEIESARTETSTSWSNPDGTTTTDHHANVIRYRDKGIWRDVDLNFGAATDGSVSPRRHARGLRVSGKTTRATEDVIVVSEGSGRELAWGWKKKLPAPVIEGTKATFPEIDPGVDMVIESRRSGFESSLVIKNRPTGAMSWEIPLRTTGLTPRAEEDGSISFLSASGKVLSMIPPAVAWDAAINPNTGDHVNVSPVAMTIAVKNKNHAVLTLTPRARWLLSADRVLPITIDPSYASLTLSPNFDAFVQEGISTDQSTSTELKLGNNGASQRARSFIKFGSGEVVNVVGKDVVSATLNIYMKHSWSCTARNWTVWDTDAAGSATRWTSQPTWGSQRAIVSTTKGWSSSCSADWVTQNITSLVKDHWAVTGGARTIGLRAGDESDPLGWKKFDSTETSRDPYISVTYNRAPNAPAVPSAGSVQAYTPPGGSTGYYAWTRTPSFTSLATEPDADTMSVLFEVHDEWPPAGAAIATCTDSSVAPNTSASCTSSQLPTYGGPYYVRARATDTRGIVGAYSGGGAFYVASIPPAAPTDLSCPSHANESWATQVPAAAVTCAASVTGSGPLAPKAIRYKVDGGTEQIVAAQTATSASATNIQVPNVSGAHQIVAYSEGPSGLLSAPVAYSFGYGTVGLAAPTVSPARTTTGPIRVTVTGPPSGTSGNPTAALNWRVAGDAAAAWLPVSNQIFTVTGGGTSSVSATTVWNSNVSIKAVTGTDRVPTRVEVQACLTYPGKPEQCTTAAGSTGPVPVQYVPHAFGNGFPVADAGPGQVALWTGEFQLDATDVSVPGYTGSLSISRSHATYAGDPASPAQAVFGPGWIAGLDGPDAGIAGWQVIDNTRQDGTIALIDPEGTPLVFTTPDGTRRTGASLPVTTATEQYWPADENTDLSGAQLKVTGTGPATKIEFLEDDGTITAFTPTTVPALNVSGVFAPASVTEVGANGQTTFSRDSAGRVTRIVAPTPPGVTCAPSSDPNVALLVAGCRSLRIIYATTTSGTDVAGQVKSVYLDTWDPAASGGAGAGVSVEIARYQYDTTSKRLTKVTDPRSGLATQYAYEGTNPSPRLISLTPPSLTPYQFSYGDLGDLKALAAVTRVKPAGSPGEPTATLGSYVYGVPTSGTGLPDLSETAVAAWNQTKAPTYGAAVFGPDHPVTGITTAGKSNDDWAHAAGLVFTDAQGYAVNTAVFGAGAWQLTATDYDDNGNIVREFDSTALATILAGPLEFDASPDQLATKKVYNSADIVNGVVVTPAGTLLKESFGPARVALVKDGSPAGGPGPCPGQECMAWVRPHTVNTYDQNAPGDGTHALTGAPYRLLTTTKTTVEDPGSGLELETLNLSRLGYDAIETGDTTGWLLGAATTKTVDLPDATADIIRTTRYDAEGRVIETRQPASTGSDAGTRRTTYYTAGTNAVSACGNKPEWAGLTCQIAPGDGAGSAVPTTQATGYTYLLAPTTTVETAGSTTRTTTVSYLADGRAKEVSTAVTGLNGSEPVPAVRTNYDSFTGLPTEQVQLNSSGAETAVKQSFGYDAWGRTTSYTPSGGDAATTAYDAAGRVASVSDPTGITTWSYDGAGTGGLDALGRVEHRGLPTKVVVSNPGGADVEVTGAYNGDGNLLTQILPGGITQTTSYDSVGQPAGLTYSGQVGSDPNGAWLSWANTRDVAGRVRQEWTPAGAAYTDAAVGGENGAIAYERRFSYDRAGRLATANDRTADATGITLDPDDPPALAAACVTRKYIFDTNGNRTGLDRWSANIDGSCGTPGSPNSSAWSYNSADQLTTGANNTGSYTYDALGRATTVPAVDTPHGASVGNLGIGYYDTDAVHTLTQNGATTTYALDVEGRRQTAQTVQGSTTTTLTRHYADGGDNPAWVVQSDGSGSTTTRYAGSLGGAVPIELTNGAVTLRLSNPHGDTVTTVSVPASGPATNITAWSDYDEYGTSRTPAAAATVAGAGGYGWLGGMQRATDDVGVLLMGARLYNPTTGQFTSTDPVVFGNDTAYSYPNDPVNMTDLSGECGRFGNPFKKCGPFRIDDWSRSDQRWRGLWYSIVREGRQGHGHGWGDGYGNFGWEHIKFGHLNTGRSSWTDEGKLRRDVKNALQDGTWTPKKTWYKAGQKFIEWKIVYYYTEREGCRCHPGEEHRYEVTVIYWEMLYAGWPLGVKTAWINRVG